MSTLELKSTHLHIQIQLLTTLIDSQARLRSVTIRESRVAYSLPQETSFFLQTIDED